MTPPPPAPVLVLAPHLEYPTRNGADISLDRIARYLSGHVPFVTLVGRDVVVRFEGGQEAGREAFDNAFRSKAAAGLRTVLGRSHFLLEKFLTPAYRRVARRYLQERAYGTVLHSYLLTTALVTGGRGGPSPARQLVWTHNDEFKWFEDLERARNPLVRMAARRSLQWLHRFFRRHGQAFLLLHVTESDRAGFARYYPDHAAAIVPIGVDVAGAVAPLPPGASPVRLLFVGSLGVKMNLDALQHFAERYEPYLREHASAPVEVVVAGSQPAAGVVALCRSRGWTLHADVSDEALRGLFEQATFSLLPFGYATGAKLKLLHSLAHGVPFLATEKVGGQQHAAVPPSLIADDPAAWLARIEAVRTHGIGVEERAALLAVAQQHAWRASAARLAALLQAPPTR